MSKRTTPRWRMLRNIAAAAAIAALVPLLAPGYLTFQLTQTIGLGIALLGLNVLTGWAGQPSLGQGAFFAIGAYATAILGIAGLPWWLALPAAAVLSAGLAWLLGQPLLRLSHIYLALATFALALAVPQLLRLAALARWTGGAKGLEVARPAPPALLAAWVSPDAWMYWIALAVAALIAIGLTILLSGRLGLELRCLRDHPVAAAACGVDVTRSKTTAFVLSALCAGTGGGLYALNVQLVTPDSFTIFLSLTMLVALVIGGAGTSAGPWIGALFLQFMPSWAERVSTAAPWAVFGAAVLLVVFLAPNGIAGAWRRRRPAAA